MGTLGIILARAGSKGLPGKCMRPLLGRPLIDYTFDHALNSELLDHLVLTTDHAQAAALARVRGIAVMDRPTHLAGDEARVDQAAMHALTEFELRWRRVAFAVLLYGNIPVRPPGAIDAAIRLLKESGADSVRTVAPVGKHHPDWMYRLHGDRITQYRPNQHYRRQDLEPLFAHDGAVVAVTRESLDRGAHDENPQAFWGVDSRALVVPPGAAIDVDDPADLFAAEAALRWSQESEGVSPQPEFAGARVP